jgi:hypothetical protein
MIMLSSQEALAMIFVWHVFTSLQAPILKGVFQLFIRPN